jgi:hypothetical protein
MVIFSKFAGCSVSHFVDLKARTIFTPAALATLIIR